MIYEYKCTNIVNCKEYNLIVEINKNIKDSSRTEYCSKCNEEMKRVYTSPGIKTSGDKYKA